MRAKLLETDSNENGESKDNFEEYRPSTPTPSSTENGIQHPTQQPNRHWHLPLSTIIIYTGMSVNYK